MVLANNELMTKLRKFKYRMKTLSYKISNMYCNIYRNSGCLFGLLQTSFSAKPDGTNRVKFQCSGVKDLVQVEKLLYEGEEDESNLAKYRERVKKECYVQSAQAVEKGSKVTTVIK